MPASRQGNEIDAYIGSRIRARRNERGLSQEKLGEALGVSFQQVQKYEKGANRISPGRLSKVADTLNTDIAFFFDGAPDGSAKRKRGGGVETRELTQILATRAGVRLCTAFLDMKNAKAREMLVEVAERLASM